MYHGIKDNDNEIHRWYNLFQIRSMIKVKTIKTNVPWNQR